MSSLPKILLVLALVSLACSRVFLKFDQFEESVDLYKFFYDLQEGYYVDIGAFDPMVYSNSLWMYSRGWAGINVEANPVRFNRIHYGKRRDLNLNFAIAQNLTYTTLYDIVGTEAMSTINSEVKDTLINKNYKVTKTDVPTMTMKELCHRYYLRKPNYMNLDIEGFSTFALLGNDWTDPKCMPEIITIEVNHSFNDSKIQSPQSILKSHGYRYHSTRGLSQFWIQGAAYDKFIQKYEKGTVAMKGLPVAPVEWSISSLYKHLGFKPKGEGDQIDVLNEPFYYYFPKQNSKIYLEQINRESNLYCNGTDKPILIINFNHENTALTL